MEPPAIGLGQPGMGNLAHRNTERPAHDEDVHRRRDRALDAVRACAEVLPDITVSDLDIVHRFRIVPDSDALTRLGLNREFGYVLRIRHAQIPASFV